MERRQTTTRGLLAVALVAVLALTGCGPALIPVKLPEAETHESVPLEGATAVRAEIRMAFGELKVGPGATAGLMEGDFVSRPPELRPDVTYSLVTSSTGELRVVQPEREIRSAFPRTTNGRSTADVRLAEGVPMDLSVKLGVGHSRLDLGRLDLKSLEVIGGIGDTDLDLVGPRRADLRVDVECGIGSLTMHVPHGVGVRVVGAGDGIGGVEAYGSFRGTVGDAMVNAAYETTATRIEVRVLRGVGSVRVTEE